MEIIKYANTHIVEFLEKREQDAGKKNIRRNNSQKFSNLMKKCNLQMQEAQTKHNIKNAIDKQRIKEKMIKEILEENKKLSKDNTSAVKMKIDHFTKMQNNDMNLLNNIPSSAL